MMIRRIAHITCVMCTYSSFAVTTVFEHTGTAIVCRVASRNSTYSRGLTVAHLRVRAGCGDRSEGDANVTAGPSVYERMQYVF